MYHRSTFCLMVILASLFPWSTSARRSQPWQRATSPNGLPGVAGATIDRTSLIVEKEGVLVNYISNNVTFSTATRALIVIHGVHRDGWDAFIAAQESLAVASRFDTTIPSSTVIMAVRPNSQLVIASLNEFRSPSPSSSTRLITRGINLVAVRQAHLYGGVRYPTTSRILSVEEFAADSWIDGDNSLYPSRAQNSSFTALDAAISYFANKNAFPKMTNIVLAGHSAGGQSEYTLHQLSQQRVYMIQSFNDTLSLEKMPQVVWQSVTLFPVLVPTAISPTLACTLAPGSATQLTITGSMALPGTIAPTTFPCWPPTLLDNKSSRVTSLATFDIYSEQPTMQNQTTSPARR